jgi:glycosyltransferase involved in cell wall biosynthesis
VNNYAFPRIAILMCTYNGEKYLREQLDSIQNQTVKNWTLYVSDDGSRDGTLSILKEYQKTWGPKKLIIKRGPKKNFCQNFLQLICDKNILANLYFLSDQDDIWMPSKLSHTIKKLSKFDLSKPLLYCARTTYVSSDARDFLGYSDLFLRSPSFKNALVQSIAGGNTMAFNNPLKIVIQTEPKAYVYSHDWWLYCLNEFVGGQTFYDKKSTIFYRQHSKSLIGSNKGFFAKIKRLKLLLNGTFREFITLKINALNKFHSLGVKSNIELLNQFSLWRDKSFRFRVGGLKDSGLYRQTWEGQLALYLGVILKKI